jgi:hypothetical protein
LENPNSGPIRNCLPQRLLRGEVNITVHRHLQVLPACAGVTNRLPPQRRQAYRMRRYISVGGGLFYPPHTLRCRMERKISVRGE